MELGEGLTKLRRAGFENGPLHDFEREASAVLEFVYNTQLEHAACEEILLLHLITSCHSNMCCFCLRKLDRRLEVKLDKILELSSNSTCLLVGS